MSQGNLKRDKLVVIAERAVLVAVLLRDRPKDADPEDADIFGELRALAETAGASIVGELIQRRHKPSGKSYLGKGKLQELADLVKMTKATLVIFDNDLAPSQIGAIEEVCECKVIDRSELILDIFANRATTHAAKLQVEIAQLEYTYPRLRAMWSHLERIVGGSPVGIGTRGPGEQQLEIDRRIVNRRKQMLRKELADIEDRKSREVAQRNLDHFTVGLVGYTNAGKSTLFNRLTEGGAYAQDQLFSTLTTRVNRWNLGGGSVALLSDTVGFIRDLPHHLVASFRATLEETRYAKLLFILLDVTDESARKQLRTVHRTLDEIGATEQPRVLLLNKIDRLEQDAVEAWHAEFPEAIPISAKTGRGLDRMVEVAREHMLGGLREVEITIPLREGRTVDFLEKRTQILERTYGDGDVTLRTRIGRNQLEQALSLGGSLRVNGGDPHRALSDIWSSAPANSGSTI